MSFGSDNQNYNDEMKRTYGHYRLGYEPLTQSAKEDNIAENSPLFNLFLMTEEMRKRKGQYSGYTLTLIQDAPSTFIDFVNRNRNINAPPNTFFPGVAVFDLDITNLGTGTLFFSVGMSSHEGGTAALINGGRKEFSARRPTWDSITLRATGANCIVNIGIGI